MHCNRDATSDKVQDADIREVPDINEYDDIIKAAKTGRLVVFIGAGVSKQIGLPLWGEFAYNRLETIYKNGLIDYRTYCDLRSLEPKKLLTVCEMFLKENSITPQPAKEVFKITNYEEYKEVYGKLYSMNAIYVTTNYDECLDNFALNKIQDREITAEESSGSIKSSRMSINEKTPLGEVVIKQSDLLESKLQNGNVIHIHGSVNDESGMVVTLNDYMLHYGNLSKDNYPELSIFLDRIFNTKYVVLFIGYGLEEYEILEYMLSKVKNPENTRKHFLLYNCFKEDKKLVNILRRYYLGFGVELIPYDISRTGYSQLITIIDEWSKVLKKYSNEQDYLQKMQFIDEVIADRTDKFETNVKAVIDMVKKDEALETYLFSKINDVRWFDILIENGFYNPERVPIPIPINQGQGYSIPYWVNTNYLNNLLSNSDNLNKIIIEKILNILKSVSLYKDNEGNTIDNYHVWNQFIEIISKIPNEYITGEILELTRVWTKSRFKIDFVVRRMGEALLGKFLNTDCADDFNKVKIVADIVTGMNEDNKKFVIGEYHFQKLFDEETVELIAKKCSMDFLEGYCGKISEALWVGSSRSIIKNADNEYLIKLTDDKNKLIVSILQNDVELLSSIIVNKSDVNCKVLYVREIPYCNYDKFEKDVLEWLYQIFNKSKVASNVHLIIRNLYYGLYSKGTYYSLYESRRRYGSDADKLLLHFYKDIILKKFQIEDIDEIKIDFLNRLLNNRYFALKKVALYVIGSLQDKYLNVIWNNLDSEIMKLIFEESYFADELRVVLEGIKQIDEKYASKVLKLIECGPYNKHSIAESEIHKKAWKIKRLNALRHIPYFEKYINNNYGDINSNIKLGPTIGEVQTGWNTGKTPLEQDDLAKMTNEELSSFISTFKTQNRWEGATVEALGRVVKEFVKNNPEKYDCNLMPFMNSPYHYVYEIFCGLLDAWKEKKLINWENILDFMLRYINRDEFWDDAFVLNDDYCNANHNLVIGIFVDLLSEGTRDDKWAMGYDYVLQSKNIILFILGKIVSLVEENADGNYLEYVLNSIKGRVLEALVCISFYFKRNFSEENRDVVQWDDELQAMFKKYLDLDIIDAYILFGEYLPQFMSLDKDWCINKIKSINYENKNWEGFMVGYLYSTTIYKDIYVLMKNHYIHSINHDFRKKEVIEDVANHIALGYLNGFEEEINNELFDSMIEKWNYDMLSKILWYFCTFDDKLDYSEEDADKEEIPIEIKGKTRQKIIDFWEVLYNRYNNVNADELNDEDKKLLSDSVKLIGVIESIDENSAKLIRFAIPYVEINYNSYELIEKIYEISSDIDSTDKRLIIGELLLDLVTYVVPTYPEEEIIKLVKYLYETGDEKVKECADSICNIYAKHNYEFLREICLENRDF